MAEKITHTENPLQNESPQPDFNRILVYHHKLWGLDGVSLEAQKLGSALENLGKEIYWASCDAPSAICENGKAIAFPELNYQDGDVKDLNQKLFGRDAKTTPQNDEEEKIMAEIERIAKIIEERINAFIKINNIGIIHIRNISLPWHLPSAIAWRRIIENNPDRLFILHHHDFIWEASGGTSYETPYSKINNLITSNCPPRITSQNCIHIAINSIAAKEFEQRYGTKPHVLPDSFDFDKNPPKEKFTTQQLVQMRKDMEIGETDFVVGVATRIIKRKKIENTIALAAAFQRHLGESKKVVIAFMQNEDTNTEYLQQLLSLAQQHGIEVKMIFQGKNNADFYDLYAIPDVIPFCPEYEGFGNQLLEIIWSGFIPIVNEYPVFQADIKNKIVLHFISLNSLEKNGAKATNKLQTISDSDADTIAQQYLALYQQLAEYQKQAKENIESARQFCHTPEVAHRLTKIIEETIKKLQNKQPITALIN